MSIPREEPDERAPLLPTSSNSTNSPAEPSQTPQPAEDDLMEIVVNKKLTRVDIAWRIVFTAFVGFLVAITIKAIVDTDKPDVSAWFRLYALNFVDI